MTTVAVTGVTGHVGGLVVGGLVERGVTPRLVVRDPASPRLPVVPGAEVQRASYGAPDDARAALAGVDVLLMVSASESADRLEQHRAFVDAAADAGVRHVVYTSFLGAAPDCTFTLGRDHWATERHLRASGMACTILRDSFYLDLLPEFGGPDGVIRGPAGDGRVGAVARADVARVATTVLVDPEPYAGATLDLTGPEALSLADIARITTEVRGTSLTFVDETLEEAYASRASYGAPDWQVEAWVSTYVAIACGELDVVTDTVEQVTGRRPLSLRDLLAAGR